MPSVEELSAQLAKARAEVEQLKTRNAQLETKVKEQVEFMGEIAERVRVVNEMFE